MNEEPAAELCGDSIAENERISHDIVHALTSNEDPALSDVMAIVESCGFDGDSIPPAIVTACVLFFYQRFHDVDKIVAYTGYKAEDVTIYISRLIWNDVWRKCKNGDAWLEEEGDGVAFTCDALVACGTIRCDRIDESSKYGRSTHDESDQAHPLSSNDLVRPKSASAKWSTWAVVRALIEQHAFNIEAALTIAHRGWLNEHDYHTPSDRAVTYWMRRCTTLPIIPEELAKRWKERYDAWVAFNNQPIREMTPQTIEDINNGE